MRRLLNNRLLRPHVVDFKMEPVRRQMRRRIGRHARPGFVGGAGKTAVEKEQNDPSSSQRGRLPECQAHSRPPDRSRRRRVGTCLSTSRSTKLLRAACGQMSRLSRFRSALVAAKVISHCRIHSSTESPHAQCEAARSTDPSDAAQDPAGAVLGVRSRRSVFNHVLQLDDRRGALHQISRDRRPPECFVPAAAAIRACRRPELQCKRAPSQNSCYLI